MLSSSELAASAFNTCLDVVSGICCLISELVFLVFLKGIRLESFKKCDFIPVDYVEVRQVKSSFKKLLRACVPSAAFTDPEKGFLRAIQDSEWLNQIQNILQISGAVIDLLDVQGSSVMVCLEDGWDFSTQVCLCCVVSLV